MINVRLAGMFLAAVGDDRLAIWHAAARSVTIADLFGTARSLGVIIPHADDETLGCGGLIAAAIARGIAVTVTVLTDGAASHPGARAWPPARLARRRRREVRAALAVLGGADVMFAAAPDGELADHRVDPALVPRADLFVTCWQGDPHADHRAAYAVAQAAARRWSAPLLAFPLWTLTTDDPLPALPLLRIDVSAFLRRKRAALACHRSQLGIVVRDRRGFVLDAGLQRLFLRSDELFLCCPID